MALFKAKYFEANPEFTSNPRVTTNPVVDNDLSRKKYVDDGLALKEDAANKGQANGYASLDGSGKVPSAQLPSYVDDVLEFADLASFPVTGETGKIYIALDTDRMYRWTGSTYQDITGFVDSVNGQTGAVVLDTDDVAEGSTNLYYTDARAKLATVDDTAYNATSWDGVTDTAPSKNAVRDEIVNLQTQIDNAVGSVQAREIKTLSAGDITNGYIDMANEALTDSLQVHIVGGLLQEPLVDFTESLNASVTRVTFAGDMLNLVAGDKVIFYYEY